MFNRKLLKRVQVAARKEFYNANTVNLLSASEFLAWATSASSLEEFHHLHQLTQNNVEVFTRKFGPPDFKIKNSRNRLISVWKFAISTENFNGTIWALTAPARGTSYEIQGDLNFPALKDILTELILTN